MVKAKLIESITGDFKETEFPKNVEQDIANPFFSPDTMEIYGDIEGQNKAEINEWIGLLMQRWQLKRENVHIKTAEGGVDSSPPEGGVREGNPIMRFFDTEHLPEELQQISGKVGELAQHMDEILDNSAEKSAGLRKLLEAKDCFVRAYVASK